MPIEEEKMKSWGPVASFLFKFFLGTPLKLWASVGHWAIWHFDLSKYTEKQRPRVRLAMGRTCRLQGLAGWLLER